MFRNIKVERPYLCLYTYDSHIYAYKLYLTYTFPNKKITILVIVVVVIVVKFIIITVITIIVSIIIIILLLIINNIIISIIIIIIIVITFTYTSYKLHIRFLIRQ